MYFNPIKVGLFRGSSGLAGGLPLIRDFFDNGYFEMKLGRYIQNDKRNNITKKGKKEYQSKLTTNLKSSKIKNHQILSAFFKTTQMMLNPLKIGRFG